jgi:hypothetical protein
VNEPPVDRGVEVDKEKIMGFHDDIEKALTVFKKPEVTLAQKPGSIAGLIGTVRHLTGQSQAVQVRPQQVQPQYKVEHTSPVVRPQPSPVRYGEANTPVIRDQVELPRMCASRRMPFMSRYILAGRWEYSCSIRVDRQAQYELYEARVHDAVEFTGETGYETCPWCGSVGKCHPRFKTTAISPVM